MDIWVRGVCATLLLLSGAWGMTDHIALAGPWMPSAPSMLLAAQETPQENAISKGILHIEVVDAIGKPLSAKVELHPSAGGLPIMAPVREGKAEGKCPIGFYEAFTYTYYGGVPFLVDVQSVEVKADAPVRLAVRLVEGSRAESRLAMFDKDGDLALDRVEIAVGVDPADPCSVPGRTEAPRTAQPTLEAKEGWYKGELHARSRFGGGAETVAELVKRAEALKLDFLAITDRNTMAAARDPGFTSNSVVLIPALEWGDEKNGVALIYGPGTEPGRAYNTADAQGIVWQVQAQGGVYAIAHPCFEIGPWQWGVGYVNAVEVWCRGWRNVPPLALDRLNDFYRRTQGKRLVHSIARAASTEGLSANGQAALFWNYELDKGLYASVIGGSMTSSPQVPMAQPVTYVFAEEKSLRGILDGLRRGRTYVAAGPDRPTVQFTADVRKDGLIDIGVGGVMPVGVETMLELTVKGAKGKKAQVMAEGKPIQTKIIEGDGFMMRFPVLPDRRMAYWARVIDTPKESAFGDVDVLAITSPIYAHEMVFVDKNVKPEDARIRIQKQQIMGGMQSVGPETSTGQGSNPWEAPQSGGTEILPQWRY